MFLQLLSVSHLLCFPTFRVRDEAPIKMKRRTDGRKPRGEGKSLSWRGKSKRGRTSNINEYVYKCNRSMCRYHRDSILKNRISNCKFNLECDIMWTKTENINNDKIIVDWNANVTYATRTWHTFNTYTVLPLCTILVYQYFTYSNVKHSYPVNLFTPLYFQLTKSFERKVIINHRWLGRNIN